MTSRPTKTYYQLLDNGTASICLRAYVLWVDKEKVKNWAYKYLEKFKLQSMCLNLHTDAVFKSLLELHYLEKEQIEEIGVTKLLHCNS